MEKTSECVPVILVNATFKSEEIKDRSIDCSVNPNAEVTWKINASGLCCANLTTEIDDKNEKRLVCKEEDLTGFCPKMKLWSSINSSNSVVLNDERYIFNITQKVCRNNATYNNAKSAFIVANYSTSRDSIEYILRDSEIKLIKTEAEKLSSGEKSCNGINVYSVNHKIIKNGDEIIVKADIKNSGVGYCKLKACVYSKGSGGEGKVMECEPTVPYYKNLNAGQTMKVELSSDLDANWDVGKLNGAYYFIVTSEDGEELYKKGPVSVKNDCSDVSVSVTHEIKYDWWVDDEINIYATVSNAGKGYCNVQAYVYPKDATENIEYEPNWPNYRTVDSGQSETIKLTSVGGLYPWGVGDLNGEYTVKIKDEDGNVLVTSDSILVEGENCDNTFISDVTHEIIPNWVPGLDDNVNIYVTIENTGTGYCPVRAFVYPKNAVKYIEKEPDLLYITVNAGQSETIKLTSINDVWWVTSLKGEYTVRIKNTGGNQLDAVTKSVS